MTSKTARNSEFLPILQLIARAQTILLCTHQSPDGDALGSMLALNSCLMRMGKKTSMVCHDAVPTYLQFLPGQSNILLPRQLVNHKFDLALSIDASDLERLGDSGILFQEASVSIQMDHHKTNDSFAGHNLVLDDLPASGSIVFRFIQAAGMDITQDEAICIYTAITTDTGNLCFGSISPETFEQMAELMRAGLPLIETARQLHLIREKEHVLMLGRALCTLRFHMDGRLTSMVLSKEDYKECGATTEHTDKIVNYGLYIPGVQMSYLAHETDNGIKFSLRSIAPLAVSGIASKFGGGGHTQAAGCTINEPLAVAIAMLQKAAQEEFLS